MNILFWIEIAIVGGYAIYLLIDYMDRQDNDQTKS
jgi:uncharacterized membrane-anchored protein